MIYTQPGQPASKVTFRTRYENYIGGEWVAPVQEEYFENVSPVNGKVFCEVARSRAEDIEKALDAAHAAKTAWGSTSVAERALILNRIADRMEANLEMLAVAETWDNGKPIRETLNADLPLAIDHFRYFAGVVRAQEGTISQIDNDTVAYHFHEPLGVVGQIIPLEFPALDGDVEAGSGAGGRQLRRPEAGRADTRQHHGADGAHRGPAAARRGQRGQRLRHRGREAARHQQENRQDRLYRGNHDRTSDHAVRFREHHSRDAGAGRQVSEYLFQRCL